MKKGCLSEYFSGVVAKRLTAVEANPKKSNQHEFQGVKLLRSLLGDERSDEMPTRFLYISAEDDKSLNEDGFLTWYNCRENKPRSPEYHLYYSTTTVSEVMQEGDLLIIARKADGKLFVIVAQGDSTVENQLLWLFGIAEVERQFIKRDYEGEQEDIPLNFASRIIIEELGIEIEEPDDNLLDALLSRYGGKFPKTAEFSAFARQTVGISSLEGADTVLMAWMEKEEALFRILEHHIVAERLRQGFGEDVDAFINFSLSVQNRRKSRVGHALENHLEQIFSDHAITCSRGKMTENRAKPDFVFPSITQYHDADFPAIRLTMLGVKSTCKDRWRQVLSEARRIEKKHLFTLEPGISENQTNEMMENKLTLVLPKQLHSSYKPAQQISLMQLEHFIELARERQNSA
jgi:hypothetical protein